MPRADQIQRSSYEMHNRERNRDTPGAPSPSSSSTSVFSRTPDKMIARGLTRFIHTNYLLCNSSKKTLAELRKKTGYTFVNCKKALELHNGDMEKAEEWLREQAQAQGWSQAEKLQYRATTQGLVALVTEQNYGALVEINCETDFVARNQKFHDLTEIIASTVLRHGMTKSSNTPVSKLALYPETLKDLSASDGKTLGDHTALTIGSVGENINIRRALCMSVHPDIKLFGYTHPAPINPIPVSFGRYGALLALKTENNDETLGTQLCQHIIGMNPSKVGDPKVDEPQENLENETVLLYQEYLFDSSISVQTLLKGEEAEVVDFVRFEVGEVMETDKILESIETCG